MWICGHIIDIGQSSKIIYVAKIADRTAYMSLTIQGHVTIGHVTISFPVGHFLLVVPRCSM